MKIRKVNSKFFAVAEIIFVMAVAVLLMAAGAYAQSQGGTTGGCGDGVCMNVGCLALNCAAPETWENCPQDCLASCSDGFKNQDETGVDCGGSCALTVGCKGNCTSAYIDDYCDGKDNDKDCMVDEDCKPQRQPVAAPQPAKPAPCYNGELDEGEEGVDCGGTCFKDWIIESCDGIDNDRDCQVDEGGVCNAKTNDEVISTNVQEGSLQPTVTPTAAPGPATVPPPTSAPQSVSAPAVGSAAEPSSGQAQQVPSIPSEQSPSTLAVEVGGEEQIKWLRQFAKSNSVYIPDAESDAELLKKYTVFTEKHEAELIAKFQDKSPTEKDIADVLKQFSEETYPKPVQAQSFFSKVAGFFRRMFG